MSQDIRLDVSYAEKFVTEPEAEGMKPVVLAAQKTLLEKTGPGAEFTGWVRLPKTYDREEFSRIKKAAEKIRDESRILVVTGVGGSYLGARAAIEFLSKGRGESGLRVLYAGSSLNPDQMNDLLDELEGTDFSVNIISKSGTTTEPAIAFRILKALLEERYGKKGAADRIYATTDKRKGTLKELADAEGYETFVVPDDIGGRYSVLSAVGLLPIAAAGGDIDALMQGAGRMAEICQSDDPEKNPALLYALYRCALEKKGMEVEVLSNYDAGLHQICEWWKQLFGESLGKEHQGLFPAGMDLTTDLHSMGQYIQDGRRNLIETVLDVKNAGRDIRVPEVPGNADGLQYLNGRSLNEINHKAMEGSIIAHAEGGVPVMRIELDRRDEDSLGQLFCFFEYACGICGYANGVNPFDQPGVEFYKRNMFRLLGKPGYENK